MGSFNGFPKETFEFFEKLKLNNSKDWFQANRGEYDEFVKKPSEQFVVEMGELLQVLAPRINAIPKVNQSLFRINRDTRFSKDKSPYKTNLGIWFWEGERKRMECSGFYFHYEDGKIMLGTGVYVFQKELLGLYRDAVVDKKLGRELKRVSNKMSEKGYEIGRKHYKRIPQGYDVSHENADFLLFKGLTAMIEEDISPEIHSSAILDHVFEHFRNMQPIHGWLIKALVTVRIV